MTASEVKRLTLLVWAQQAIDSSSGTNVDHLMMDMRNISAYVADEHTVDNESIMLERPPDQDCLVGVQINGIGMTPSFEPYAIARSLIPDYLTPY